MTEESSNSVTDRMTRLEANLDRFIDFVSQNQRTQQLQLQSQQAQIDALNGLTRQLAETQIEMFTRFDQMQVEIRGLQTENRRILDRLLNQEPPEHQEG